MSLLADKLRVWFGNVFDVILKRLRAGDVNYLYQVEEIIRDHTEEYKTILSEQIQDYYVEVSENKEAMINNKVAQKSLDNLVLISSVKDDKQYNLDDFLDYDYATQDTKIAETIKKKLRYGKNAKNSLNKYLYQRVDMRSLQPSDLSVLELFEYQVDEAIIDYMTSNVFTASESTLSRVTQDIYEIIREVYGEQGEGTRSLTEEIMNRFSDLADYEAERIARTETLKAQSSATYNRLVNNPDVEYIQWMATGDEVTRDSHMELDGQITYADGSGVFSNGLQYPGDTNGELEEWINCRCDPVAFVPDVGLVPPAGAENWYEDEMLFDNSIVIPEVYVELEEYLASYW